MSVRCIGEARPALAIALFLLAACGGSDPVAPPPTPPPPPPPPVTVSVTPTTASVPAGGTQTFSATVANSTNAAVTWTASGGSLTPNGANASWTAPVTGGSYTITAASVADATKSAAATVTVSPVAVSVAPATVSLYRGEPAKFSAAVSGAVAGSGGVTWSASCGDVTVNGDTLLYVAPNAPGDCAITARSALDTTKTASAAVSVRSTWLVDRTEDTADTVCTWNSCTLRTALTLAQATPALDTIRLGLPAPASRMNGKLAGSLTGTITLTSPLPAISTPVAIIGPGADVLAIDANGSVTSPRLVLRFEGSVTASVSGLTLRGGYTPGAAGVAVLDRSNVTLTNMVVRENVSTLGAGGGVAALGASTIRLVNTHVVDNRAEGPTAAAAGVEVAQGSTLEMTGGSIRRNIAPDGFGAGLRQLDGIVTLVDVDVSENEALLFAGGGGIMAEGVGSLTIRRGRVSSNRTAGSGGGLWARGPVTVALDSVEMRSNRAEGSSGGAVLTQGVAVLSMADGVVAENFAQVNGGGLSITDSTTATLVRMDVSGNDARAGGGMILFAQANATLTDVTFTDNEARGVGTQGGGGGLFDATGTNLTINGGVIANNRATGGSGGGLISVGSGTLLLEGTEIHNNSAGAQGGGVGVFAPSTGRTGTVTMDHLIVRDNRSTASGGGVSINAPAALTRSTLHGNTSVNGIGGGVFSGFFGLPVITNVTISGNTAAVGGGVGATGTNTLRHVTIVGNTSTDPGAGVYTNNSGAVTMTGVLLSGNLSGGSLVNCLANNASTISSNGFNLSNDASCVALTLASDRANTPAGVSDSLADNGGPTRTHALLEGSAAIDAGGAPGCPTTDQRGRARVGACDIGAFEFGAQAARASRAVSRARMR